MKKITLITLLLLSFCYLHAQDLPSVYTDKISVADLHEDLATLKEIMTRDGVNETLPIATINRNFASWYLNLIGNPDSYDLELIAPDGTKRNVTLKGTTLSHATLVMGNEYNF